MEKSPQRLYGTEPSLMFMSLATPVLFLPWLWEAAVKIRRACSLYWRWHFPVKTTHPDPSSWFLSTSLMSKLQGVFLATFPQRWLFAYSHYSSHHNSSFSVSLRGCNEGCITPAGGRLTMLARDKTYSSEQKRTYMFIISGLCHSIRLLLCCLKILA